MDGMVEALRPRVSLRERARGLAELQRQAERVLDHEAQARERMDAKTQHVMGVGLATLAGSVALATFASENLAGRAGWGLVAAVGLAALANLAAMVLLAAAYVGFRAHAELAIGPGLDWLADKAQDPSWTCEETHLNVLAAVRSFSHYNRAGTREAARWRRRAIYLLGLAVVLDAGVGLYVLAKQVIP